ncbi:MAG: ABC transporter ATP-binding protein [Planctomycetota bacterium]
MLIELNRVTKLYGRVIGTNDISISLPAGAYGLLGPNGSGKSTLLNLIMGQLEPTIGSVRVLGESPINNAKLFRCLGFCPSHEGMYANISGYQWVRYLQELQGHTRREAKRLTEAAMERVGMTYAMHRNISGYSRGMRQRTKLAQAIAHEPDFLILDEPFNGLDPIARHEVTTALRSWIDEGKSLLLASHVLHEVESVTQSFLLICGGRLLASGTASEVQELLADLPNEITVRSNSPHQVATLAWALETCDAVRVEGDAVHVTTRDPSRLVMELPTWAMTRDIKIQEVGSADESLQTLFNTLLRIHRGEI